MLIPYNEHRKAIEMIYEGRCTVIVRSLPDDPRLEPIETKIYENEPCRLSFGSSSTIEGMINKATQTTTLMISPDVRIPTGSKIIVVQAGETTEYTKSGIPSSYNSHKEYILEAFKEWN